MGKKIEHNPPNPTCAVTDPRVRSPNCHVRSPILN